MNRRAFTLMEMVLVMAIIGLVFAGTVIGFAALNAETVLQKPYVELRSMAKTAWQRALMEQRAWQIVFYGNRFEIQPRRAVNEADDKMFHDSDVAKGRGSGVKAVELPEGITMEVQRWASDVWIRPTDKEAVSWIFEQSGLCEPISVRFRGELGVVGAEFDPLTASVMREIFDEGEE